MAIKYGPEGYNSPEIRRFQDNQPPQHAATAAKSRFAGGQRILAVAVLLALLLSVGGFAKYRMLTVQPTQAPGKVLSKELTAAQEPMLTIELRLADGSHYTAKVLCDKVTWDRYKSGDRLLIQYRASGHDAGIQVIQLDPMPSPVDL